LFDLQAEAPASCGFFQAQQGQAQTVLVSQFAQAALRGMARGKQAIQTRTRGQVMVFAVDHHGRKASLHIPIEPDGAQAAHAPQTNIEQRHLRLDEPRLQQERADFSSGFNEVDAPGLGDHLGLFGCAQVRHDARANVHTLANVNGQCAFAAKDVHPGTARQCGQAVRVDGRHHKSL
jgi:hypothetical protein